MNEKEAADQLEAMGAMLQSEHREVTDRGVVAVLNDLGRSLSRLAEVFSEGNARIDAGEALP